VETYHGCFGGDSGGDGVGGVGASYVVKRLQRVNWKKKGATVRLIDSTCFQL
jgi:hypothetical protein